MSKKINEDQKNKYFFSPLGGMLRPLLEQAADPLHQYKSGASSFFPQTQNQGVKPSKDEKKIISPSVTLYNPDVIFDPNYITIFLIEF